jgi:hypothetical protein
MAWRIDRHLTGDVSAASRFYGDGVYTFLRRAEYTPVYRQENGRAIYLGLLGAVSLPAGFPAVEFTDGVDQIMIVEVP